MNFFADSESLMLQKSWEKVKSFIIESVIFVPVIGEGNYGIKKADSQQSLVEDQSVSSFVPVLISMIIHSRVPVLKMHELWKTSDPQLDWKQTRLQV